MELLNIVIVLIFGLNWKYKGFKTAKETAANLIVKTVLILIGLASLILYIEKHI